MAYDASLGVMRVGRQAAEPAVPEDVLDERGAVMDICDASLSRCGVRDGVVWRRGGLSEAPPNTEGGEANEYRLWAGGIGNRLQISMQASPATSRALASPFEIVLPSCPLPRS